MMDKTVVAQPVGVKGTRYMPPGQLMKFLAAL